MLSARSSRRFSSAIVAANRVYRSRPADVPTVKEVPVGKQRLTSLIDTRPLCKVRALPEGRCTMTGERIDLSSDGPGALESAPKSGAGQGSRPFVGMHFTCCDIYTRIYLNSERTMFYGH